LIFLALQKEAESAAFDAEAIKKRFLAVQGQANEAQHVAMETKREADKLRDKAEKAELDMAAAASMRDQQRKEREEQEKAQAPAPAPAPTSNGYPGQMSYGYGQPPAPQQRYEGYGSPPSMGDPSQSYDQPMAPPSMGDPSQSYGQSMAPPSSYQYNSMAPPAPVGGYGGGFAAGVMGGGGGGGFDLPSPNQMPAGDMYSNPFAP
jgi:septal ring factor EnvC (AmiA/AmiB activator)